MELPTPECEIGFTDRQVDEILEANKYTREEFDQWMYGQTGAICEGRAYNHDRQEYEERCGGVAHGFIYFTWDVERFLDGLPVID